jgi:hypothetical protein
MTPASRTATDIDLIRLALSVAERRAAEPRLGLATDRHLFRHASEAVERIAAGGSPGHVHPETKS